MERLFKNKGSKPTKTGFGEGLLKAGIHPDVIAIGADITTSVGVNLFAEKYPDRFISLGIAEQNCVAAAAGMALSGKIPVFSTYGVFAAFRAADQLRVSVCYNNVHVIIGGAHAGVSVGPDGATHQALEDIALTRSLPNMTVISPCDATQTAIAVDVAINKCNGPVYIRFGREAVPDFTEINQCFELGKGQLLYEGIDVCIIATGHMVWEALQSAYALKNNGVKARVINIHTIKPIDKEIIIKAAKECKAIVTAEEHQIMGGFGSAVAEVLAQNFPVPIEFVGVNDSFGESGNPDELMLKYGLTASAITEKVYKVLKRK